MTQPDIYDLLAEDETKPARTTREACPRCRRVHIYADVIPSGSRFVLHPESWRAAYDGAPSRGTRGQADQDMCDHHAEGELVTLGYELPDPTPWRHVDGARVADPGAEGSPVGGFTFAPRHGYSDHDDRYRSTRRRDECRICDRPPITPGTTTTPITTKENRA